jgi:hypothetical protein
MARPSKGWDEFHCSSPIPTFFGRLCRKLHLMTRSTRSWPKSCCDDVELLGERRARVESKPRLPLSHQSTTSLRQNRDVSINYGDFGVMAGAV